MATRVITLRPERGYSATNYDGSAVKHPKNLRRQFGKFYDGKKVRNNYRAANQLLFEVIEYVEPRMKGDLTYPSVVGLSVMRARHHGLGNEEAERRLSAELG